MQIKFTILVALLSVVFAPSARADHINYECNNLASMDVINYCAADRFKQADAQMNRLYKRKIAAITSSENIKRFRDSQRAWVIFRDKTCQYEAGLDDTGSLWPFHMNGCMEFHTLRRIKDLEEYISCTSDDCPN